MSQETKLIRLFPHRTFSVKYPSNEGVVVWSPAVSCSCGLNSDQTVMMRVTQADLQLTKQHYEVEKPLGATANK